MSAAPKRRKSVDSSTQSPPAEKITAERVRDVLVTHVVKGDKKLPNAATVATLAAKLDRLRTVLLKRSVPAASARSEAIRHMAGLWNLLPTLRESAPDAIRELEDLGPVLFQAMNTLEATSPGFWEGWTTPKWEKYVAEVVDWFVQSMQSTNPGFDPGLSYGGPVSRFVHKVMPLITGETMPEVASVTKALRRQRDHKEELSSTLPPWA